MPDEDGLTALLVAWRRPGSVGVRRLATARSPQRRTLELPIGRRTVDHGRARGRTGYPVRCRSVPCGAVAVLRWCTSAVPTAGVAYLRRPSSLLDHGSSAAMDRRSRPGCHRLGCHRGSPWGSAWVPQSAGRLLRRQPLDPIRARVRNGGPLQQCHWLTDSRTRQRDMCALLAVRADGGRGLPPGARGLRGWILTLESPGVRA